MTSLTVTHKDHTHPTERQAILAALSLFVRQRAGLEFGNYGNLTAYRAEQRQITKDRHDAEQLLAAVSWREGIDSARLRNAFRAYSGRLSVETREVEEGLWTASLNYTTGQYFPTEYRKAVCAVLAQALWEYYRDFNVPASAEKPGMYLRMALRREFGAGLQKRWWN
jgi:hypothetical protein